MSDEGRKSIGFDQARAVWSRRKWLAILIFLASFSAAITLVMSMPNIYRSKATMLIEGQQVPETVVRSAVTSEIEMRLHTITQKILSRSRLEDLITRFGLYPNLRNRASLEGIIDRMRKDIQPELKEIDLKGGRGATVAFSISYRGTNPHTVALVTNTLASFYVEENLEVRERQATEAAEFLRGQLQEMKQLQDEQEGWVSDSERGKIGEQSPQMHTDQRGTSKLNLQPRLNNTQVRARERQEVPMGDLAEGDSSDSVGGPDRIAAQIAKRKQELTGLRTRFSDKYPDVIHVKAEIAALERQLAAEKASKREQTFQGLARDHKATNELYDMLLKRYQEAHLVESMEQFQKGEEFRILDPAIVPELPVAPNRIRFALFGLMLSLGLAAGAVLLVEQIDTTFHTVDDLRAFTRVPVLMSIPKIVTPGDARWRRWCFCLVAFLVMLGLALIVGTTFYIVHENEQLVWMLTRGRF